MLDPTGRKRRRAVVAHLASQLRGFSSRWMGGWVDGWVAGWLEQQMMLMPRDCFTDATPEGCAFESIMVGNTPIGRFHAGVMAALFRGIPSNQGCLPIFGSIVHHFR